MCGIAGIIGTPDDVTRERLQTLASSLAHRGPDDEGMEVVARAGERVVGFVHRRLAIIDLSLAGHQPMRDSATGNWITFNGEIYNHRALREELERHGYAFQTQSDTEVILKAYAEYGSRCLDHLRGMFAFALWDANTQQVFAAIDRFGIKPLYVWDDGGRTFLFTSEIRCLLRTELVPRAIDPVAVDSFLAFGSVQAPRTIIAGVRALLPGHALTYDVRTRSLSIAPYWHPRVPDGRTSVATDVEVEETLRDTVAHHLVSDVPVGLFLSGGVDSSALAILAARVAGKLLSSFSVTFRESAYAEGEYARRIGERFCLEHREIVLRAEDLIETLPAALGAMDQPTIDGINAYVISAAVRATGIKVVISGQGGDEVFGGYPTFQRVPRMAAWASRVAVVPYALRIGAMPLLRICVPAGPARDKLVQYVCAPGDAVDCYVLSRQLMSADMRHTLMAVPVMAASADDRVVASWLREEIRGLDRMSTVSVLELRGYLANTLLRDGDMMSMAHGLEVRVPYLDHTLLECVLRVPEARRVDARLPKPALLRAVMDDLPREIYDRAKMGFTFPWEIWLRGPLYEIMEGRLRNRALAEAVGLRAGACGALWEQFLRRERGISWPRVWAPYVLMDWAERNVLS